MRCALCLLAVVLMASQAFAGETLKTVQSRGVLRCGVSDITSGMATKSEDGVWSGMDVDFCRAVAAAVLGDPGNTSFLPLASPARFSSLISREIDLLSRNTSHTLTREIRIGVSFVGPLVITGQAFLLPSTAAGRGLAALDRATIGVIRGTTHERNLGDIAAANGLQFEAMVFENIQECMGALAEGRCGAVTDDDIVLASVLALTPGLQQNHTLLAQRFSREIISPVVRQDDVKWLQLVKAVLTVLIVAEECHLFQKDLQGSPNLANNMAAQLMLKKSETLTQPLGLAPGWAERAIRAVGNYGEIFDRNLGKNSSIRMERGPNRLARDGGLLYAVPL